MLDPKKVAFFKANKKEIGDLISRENRRRQVRQLQPLMEEEIDEAVSEMMSLAAQNQRLRAFKFSTAGTPIEPTKQTPQSLGSLAPIHSPQPAKKDQAANFSFEAVVCSNGFLLKCASEKEQLSFIFKTEADLMQIFRETVFPELDRIRRKKTEAFNEPRDRSGPQDVGSGDHLLGRQQAAVGESHGGGRPGERTERIHGGNAGSKNLQGSPREGGPIHQKALGDPVPPKAQEGSVR